MAAFPFGAIFCRGRRVEMKRVEGARDDLAAETAGGVIEQMGARVAETKVTGVVVELGTTGLRLREMVQPNLGSYD